MNDKIYYIDKIIQKLISNDNIYNDVEECHIHNNYTPSDKFISNILTGGFTKCSCKKRKMLIPPVVIPPVVIPPGQLSNFPINHKTVMDDIRGHNIFYKIKAQIGKADFGMITQNNNNCYWRCVVHLMMKMLNEENILENITNYDPADYKIYNNGLIDIDENDKNIAYDHIKLMIYLKHMGQTGINMSDKFWDGSSYKTINQLYCDLPLAWSNADTPCVDFGVSLTVLNSFLGTIGSLKLNNETEIVGDELVFIDSTVNIYVDKLQSSSRKSQNIATGDFLNIYDTIDDNKSTLHSNVVGITLPYDQNGSDLQSYIGIGNSLYNKTAEKQTNQNLAIGENCINKPNKCEATIESIKYKLSKNAKYLLIDSGRIKYNLYGEVMCQTKSIPLNDMILYDDCILACVGSFMHHGNHYTSIIRDGNDWKYYHDSTIENPHEKVSNNIITMNNLHGDKLDEKWITVLYKIVKRGVTVVALDFDGVLHKNVGPIDIYGFRHTGNGVNIAFDATIAFIKSIINNDDVFLYILSHNPLCNTNTQSLLSNESIDLTIPPDIKKSLNPRKIEYKCLPSNPSLKYVDKVEELIKIGAKIFIDDSPIILNSCIKGNVVNYLHDQMILYYALPQHDKYIKITKQNKCLLKLKPTPEHIATAMTNDNILRTYVESTVNIPINMRYLSVVDNITL